RGRAPDGIQLLARMKSLVFEYELHVKINGSDRSDGAKAADQQQPKREIRQQIAKRAGFHRHFGSGSIRAIGDLANVTWFVPDQERYQGPGDKHQSAEDHQRRLKPEFFGQRLNDERAQRSEQANAYVDDTHGRSAFHAEPVRDDDLVRNRAGENVAGRVQNPQPVVQPQHAVHVPEPEKSEERERGADQDHLARAEAGDEQRPGPDRQQRGYWKSQCDLRPRPAVSPLEIVVKESDVVVRDPYGDAEREKSPGGDPPAMKLVFHRLPFSL